MLQTGSRKKAMPHVGDIALKRTRDNNACACVLAVLQRWPGWHVVSPGRPVDFRIDRITGSQSIYNRKDGLDAGRAEHCRTGLRAELLKRFSPCLWLSSHCGYTKQRTRNNSNEDSHWLALHELDVKA